MFICAYCWPDALKGFHFSSWLWMSPLQVEIGPSEDLMPTDIKSPREHRSAKRPKSLLIAQAAVQLMGKHPTKAAWSGQHFLLGSATLFSSITSSTPLGSSQNCQFLLQMFSAL